MGGTLSAESQAGAGSRFEVRLPCIEVAAAQPAAPALAAPGRGPGWPGCASWPPRTTR
jgi:hypothetical protein